MFLECSLNTYSTHSQWPLTPVTDHKGRQSVWKHTYNEGMKRADVMMVDDAAKETPK